MIPEAIPAAQRRSPCRGPPTGSCNDDVVLSHVRRIGPVPAVAVVLVAALAAPPPAAAHGPVPDEPPSIANLVFGWTFEPFVVLPLVVAAWAWLAAVRRVDRDHPGNPVPRRRTASFLAGLGAIAVALLSGLAAYDTTLFSAHMVQHILLGFVAAPLIVLAGPITLVLRVASPGTRRRWILPLLHSRVVRAISHPVVAFVVFTVVMWGSHFSPLFDAALESPFVHELEHALYLGAALLFWWPALGVDPSPWRLPPAGRTMYVFLQMPLNTFLAVAILFATVPLYAHYASLEAPWLPDALADQQLAGAIMWLIGDAIFLSAVFGLVALWLRREEAATAATDRRADADRARIREREAVLAERVAMQRGSTTDGEPSSG
jgi:putative copper resistance protein D